MLYLRPALTLKPPQRSPNEARSATPGASNLSSEPEPHRRHRGRCETPFSPPPGAERRAHAARLRRGERRGLAGARRGGRAARAGRARDPPSPECAVGCRPVAPTVRPGRHPASPSRSRSSSTRSASPSGPSATRSRSTRSSCSSVSACVCARRAREPRSGCAATRPSGRSCGASELCLTLPLLHECPVLGMYCSSGTTLFPYFASMYATFFRSMSAYSLPHALLEYPSSRTCGRDSWPHDNNAAQPGRRTRHQAGSPANHAPARRRATLRCASSQGAHGWRSQT